MPTISKFLTVLRTTSSGERVPAILQAIRLRNVRCYSTRKESGLARSHEKSEVSTDVRPLGEKIKETTKTASYTGVILMGIGVTGVIFYYVFRELFSSNSPNSIYSDALEKCKNDPRIEEALGLPIKGYGEETTRRRRTHVSHAVYEKEGVKHMRMRFYIQGVRNKGIVELDMKQNINLMMPARHAVPTSAESRRHPRVKSVHNQFQSQQQPLPIICNEYGNYMCRYLLVQLDDYSGKTFVIEDNRAELDKKATDFSQYPTLTLNQ